MTYYKTEAVIPQVLAANATLLSLVSGNEQVTLTTDKGVLTLTAEGDCCSQSWFESCEDFGAIGGQITEMDFEGTVKDISPSPDSGDQILVYFPVIKTTKGRVCMEMRNSSNGYYGGYVVAQWAPVSQGETT